MLRIFSSCFVWYWFHGINKGWRGDAYANSKKLVTHFASFSRLHHKDLIFNVLGFYFSVGKGNFINFNGEFIVDVKRLFLRRRFIQRFNFSFEKTNQNFDVSITRRILFLHVEDRESREVYGNFIDTKMFIPRLMPLYRDLKFLSAFIDGWKNVRSVDSGFHFHRQFPQRQNSNTIDKRYVHTQIVESLRKKFAEKVKAAIKAFFMAFLLRLRYLLTYDATHLNT